MRITPYNSASYNVNSQKTNNIKPAFGMVYGETEGLFNAIKRSNLSDYVLDHMRAPAQAAKLHSIDYKGNKNIIINFIDAVSEDDKRILKIEAVHPSYPKVKGESQFDYSMLYKGDNESTPKTFFDSFSQHIKDTVIRIDQNPELQRAKFDDHVNQVKNMNELM